MRTPVSLHLGLYVPTWPPKGGPPPRWPAMRALARDAEALEVDSLWVSDEPGVRECWTMLSALAEATERVTVGPLVAVTRYRAPALLATMIRALDDVAAGRVVVGLGSGAGPADQRWPAFGWDPTAHVARFAEAVEIVTRLLRSGPFTFAGRFERIADPNIGPPGPTEGGPRIWVAARRPRTMEVAARWGDAVDLSTPLTDRASVDAFREAADTACVAVGRDPADLPLTGCVRLAPSPDGRLDRDRDDTISGTPAEVAGRLAELHEAGVTHHTCFIGDETDDQRYPALTRRALARFAEVLEAAG